MSNYNRKRLDTFRYLRTKRNKRITKKLRKIYWGECSTERLKRMKMRVFRKKNNLDCKAVEIAKKIYYEPYRSTEDGKTIKVETYSLWEKYTTINEFDIRAFYEMKALLSAIRKAIIDGFDLANTYLYEIPYSDNQMLIAYFVNKDDYDNYHWHKKDVDIRSVYFFCYYDKLFAEPAKEVYEDDEVTIYAVKTCQEAESVID